jgi:hypothetical protein
MTLSTNWPICNKETAGGRCWLLQHCQLLDKNYTIISRHIPNFIWKLFTYSMNSRGTPQVIPRIYGCDTSLHVHSYLMLCAMYNKHTAAVSTGQRQTVPQLCDYRPCHSRVQQEYWRQGYGAAWNHTRTDYLCLSLIIVCYKGSLVVIFRPLFCVRVGIGCTYRGRNIGWGCSRKGCSRKCFLFTRDEVRGIGEDYRMRNLMTRTFRQIFCWSFQEEWDGRFM